MDRHRTLLQLTQKMSAAIAAEDWQTLTAINTMLATVLPQMAAQGSWSHAERAALAAAHQMHNEAVKRCNEATDALGRKLQQMQATQEGWLAYALDSEQADTGIHA